MIWLRRVSESGNWAGRAHLFRDRGDRKAVCEQYRFHGEEWQECDGNKCKECEEYDAEQDRMV